MKITKEILDSTSVPDIQHTLPQVFIFESLSDEDEQTKRFEGQMLCNMLWLAGKNPKYYYFQSAEELPHLVGLFRQSRYRYLHFSTHASGTEIGIRNGAVTYSRFAEIFGGHLSLRRLFFSACQIGNLDFVRTIAARNKGMHSIVAPVENIRFDHAAALWSSFYISMFTDNENAMKRSGIVAKLKALRALFPVDFFLAAYRSESDNWELSMIGEQGQTNRRIEVI